MRNGRKRIYFWDQPADFGVSAAVTHELWVAKTGKDMAETARQAIQGAVNTSVPASLLQLHAAATFLLDEEAASLLG